VFFRVNEILKKAIHTSTPDISALKDEALWGF
jgi:hypothetical protein